MDQSLNLNFVRNDFLTLTNPKCRGIYYAKKLCWLGMAAEEKNTNEGAGRNSETEEREPIRSILENFMRYEASAESRFAPLEPEFKAAIELMKSLTRRVPL